MTRTAYHGAALGAARAVCVFLHGRAQSPEQMVETVLARLDTPSLRYAMPRSPREAWYDAKAVDPICATTEGQLAESLDLIGRTVADARAECPGVPLIVAGFSQGACLTVEYLMRGGRAEAAAMLTGCRVGAPADDLPRAVLSGLPVYATCGDADPWIPLWAFQKAVGEVAASGARLRTDILPGRPHEVSATECAELSRMLRAVADGASALEGTA
jgi:phospholipase/carboxylesterase